MLVRPRIDLLTGKERGFNEKHIDKFVVEVGREHSIVLKEAVSRFLDPKNDRVRQYITRILHACFCVEAIGLSPEVLDKLSQTVQQRSVLRLYVDTNFLFCLLDIHENPSNASARELANILRSNANQPLVELYVLPPTLDEAKRVISAAKYDAARVPMSHNFTSAALRAGLSGLVAKFFNERMAGADTLSADDWFDPYLNDLATFAEAAGVTLHDAPIERYRTRQEVIDDIAFVIDRESKTLPEYKRKSYGCGSFRTTSTFIAVHELAKVGHASGCRSGWPMPCERP